VSALLFGRRSYGSASRDICFKGGCLPALSEEKFAQLKAELEEQLREEERLNALILENLDKVKIK